MGHVDYRLIGGEPPFDPGHGGGDDGGMEERLAAVEKSIVRIDQTLDFMRQTMATKEDLATLRGDLQKDMHALTWKLIGAAGLLVGAVYFVARYVH